jgi:hypothetical protein
MGRSGAYIAALCCRHAQVLDVVQVERTMNQAEVLKHTTTTTVCM